MKSNYTTLILIFGMALFAMFFGAGNFLLPSYIGSQVGNSWFQAIVGFGISGIIAPFVGILAVVLSGKNFSDLGDRIHPQLTSILATIIILCIGPLLAIPRTGATILEVVVSPLYEDASAIWTSILYFLAVFAISLLPRKIVEIVGKYLTPLLLICLVVLVIVGASHSFEILPSSNAVHKVDAMSYAFQEGYQTMDVLASVFFAGILVHAARNRGYVSIEDKNRIVIGAGYVAMALLLIVYGGLIYVGAHTELGDESLSKSQLLLALATQFFGESGLYLVSLTMILACLTTSVALTASFAYFFARITNNKMGYHEGVITCTIISIVLSISSLDEMWTYAGGILSFIYPIVLVMILFVLLFGKYVLPKTPYLVAIVTATVMSMIALLPSCGITDLESFRMSLPLSKHNLEWLLPSLFTFLVTTFTLKKHNPLK